MPNPIVIGDPPLPVITSMPINSLPRVGAGTIIPAQAGKNSNPFTNAFLHHLGYSSLRIVDTPPLGVGVGSVVGAGLVVGVMVGVCVSRASRASCSDPLRPA